ncbi:hypothetical protein FXO37_11663 [Capsicum annuum]|nr:hypothetical protein FXO37_11663 [Capsicum annuum]
MQFVLWLIYSFGYDEVHDDYKVVGVFYTYEQAEVSEKRLNGPDKFVNGKFHWAIIARGDNVYKGRNIYSFDLTDKKWEKTWSNPLIEEETWFCGWQCWQVEIYVESPVSPFPTEEREETSHQDNRATKNSRNSAADTWHMLLSLFSLKCVMPQTIREAVVTGELIRPSGTPGG